MNQSLRGGILLAMTLTLGACAPQQGSDASDEPSQAPASVAPVAPATAGPTVMPSVSAAPSESTGPTPTSSEYDY